MDHNVKGSPAEVRFQLFCSRARLAQWYFGAIAIASFVLFAGAAVAQSPTAWQRCGSIDSGPGIYGPYDYRFDKDRLPIVENHHFTPNVEFFRERLTSTFGADISYTLVAFPNHHRALAAVVRLAEKEGLDKPLGAKYSVECYFDRAIRFRPEDGTVRLLHGLYLMNKGRNAQAVEELLLAQKSSGDDPNLHYNLGLAFFRSKRFDEALAHAHAAYRLGFDLPGLRSLLVSAGKWKEPETVDGAN